MTQHSDPSRLRLTSAASDGTARRSSRRKLLGFVGLTNLGDGVALVALPLAAVTYLPNPTIAALVVACGWVAAALLSLVGGRLIDRFGAGACVTTSQGLRTAALAVAALVGPGEAIAVTAVLVAASMINSSAEWVTHTAVEAVAATSTATHDYTAAFGKLRSLEQVANRLVGPAVGGVVFAFNSRVALATCAVSYALSILLRPRLDHQRPASQHPVSVPLRRVPADPLVRSSLALGLAIAVGVGVTLGPYALFVKEVLQLPDALYGALIVIGSVGGILGGATAGRWLGTRNARRPVLTAWLVAGAAQLAFGLAPVIAVAAVASFCYAVTATWVGVAIASARQASIDDDHRGQVGGLARAVSALGLAIGAASSIPLIEMAGLRSPWIAAASIHLTAAATAVAGSSAWPKNGTGTRFLHVVGQDSQT